MSTFARPRDHDERMDAMRRRARWLLGSPSWAGDLFAAYEHPDAIGRDGEWPDFDGDGAS